MPDAADTPKPAVSDDADASDVYANGTPGDPMHEFLVVASGVPELNTEVKDALFQAGCHDAGIGYHFGMLTLDFVRLAPTSDEAITSAIRDIGKARIGARIVRIESQDRSPQATVAAIEAASRPMRFEPSQYHPVYAVCDKGRRYVSEEHRVVVRNVTFDLYDRVSEAIDEGQHTLIAFDGNDMELVKKGGILLQWDKEAIRGLVDAVTDECRMNSMNLGSCTWKRPRMEIGIEADLSLYFDLKKLAQANKALHSRSLANDIDAYPNPDLTIEVNRFPPLIDRRRVYAAMGVIETWWLEGDTITIERLGEDGRYALVETSRFLPIRVDDLRRCLDDGSDNNLTRRQRFAALAKEIASR
jgi:hypothetical protein